MLDLEDPAFIEQRVSNACGTIALLHSLVNTSLKVEIENLYKKGSLIEKMIDCRANGEDLAKFAEEN